MSSANPILRLSSIVASLAIVVAGALHARADDFVNFESSHVHPIALSADGSKLFAVNTPESRLAVFDVAGDGSLALAAEYAVGLDPVSLAVRGDEVWVVNHVSDSISIVDVAAQKLVATIQTGDEPTDIVFANGRAFVSHAGTRDQVIAWNAATRAEVGRLDIFGDDPRALAASADGSEVYVVVLESGNRTSVMAVDHVGETAPPPDPPMSESLPPAPKVALIIQFDDASGQWEDETGASRGDVDDLDVPDQDVFVIDTTSLALVRAIRGVGTTLFDVAVQPGTGKLWVSNTDARNLVRFEPNLRGHFIDTRLTVVDADTSAVMHRDLNPHIDFGVSPGPPAEVAQSIGIPGDIVFTSDGSTCYVAGFGSSNVVKFHATTGVVDQISVSGGGASGLALAEATSRLYVTNRFDNTISILDTASGSEVETIGIAPSRFDPSPEEIRNGRHLLYDTKATSGHGDSACASCHVFGNLDGIGWDLGDPTGAFAPYSEIDWLEFSFGSGLRNGFHPMKGPMVTQTLRGLEGNEPFHWRGDRRNFQHFNGAFVGLMGLDQPLADADMDAFADFIMTVRHPPNPNRTLDDGLPATIPVTAFGGGGAIVHANPANGEHFFFNGFFLDETEDDQRRPCVECHALPSGTNNTLNSLPIESQDVKIAQLRSVYEKVGLGRMRFGESNIGAPQQKSGFGVLHAGAASLTEFLFAFFLTDPETTPSDQQDIAAFLMAFPSGTPPVVGHQLTVNDTNARTPFADAEIALMFDQAAEGKCDVIVRGVIGGQAKSFVFDVDQDLFVSDSRVESPVGDVALRDSLESGDVITYTAVPAGSGVRMAIDRDRDTWRDADEALDGSDPADVDSAPMGCTEAAADSIESARFKVTLDDEGGDEVSLRGSIDLTANLTPAIDLVATGMTIDVRDSAGNVVLRRWIPPGVLQLKKTTWRLKKELGSVADGIDRALVRDATGKFKFKIRGRNTGVSVDGLGYPLTMVVTMGTSDQESADQCGRREFPLERCRVSPTEVACR